MFGLGSIVEQLQSKCKRRFNLLMLEEREYYFEDYGAFLHVTEGSRNEPAAIPFSSRSKLKGRFHLSSKSLIFDPDSLEHNILRIPLRDIASIKSRKSMIAGHVESEYFVVHTRLCIEIPTRAPYIYKKYNLSLPESEFYFSISYESMMKVLEFLNELHGMYRLNPSVKPQALQTLIKQREEGIQFESSAISDIRERVLLPHGSSILASQISPLLSYPGRFQLTDARLYFQPFNQVSSDATLKVDLSDMKRIYKRRCIMRDTALEIFLPMNYGKSGSSSSSSSSSSVLLSSPTSSSKSSSSSTSPLQQTSVYFNFSSRAERDAIYTLLTSQKSFQPARDSSLSSMTHSWCRGELSNFDYLLFINQYAGRSWMDLTQYPVMPWVLSDYTSSTLDLKNPAVYRDLSKPIGALNPERLEMLKMRMNEMPAEISHGRPFLYGTHYSSPGYVLYYLVRKAPQYMLRLQAGKFDQPDRAFHSIEATWKSVLQAPTDVKELIPEFYADPSFSSYSSSSSSSSSSSPSEFLRNTHELDLGTRQNGAPVDDVTLPPWATDARDFLTKMRAALESDYVSAHLHQWIDLIFGYKQTGEEAKKAHNLFFYLTYEGSVDLDTITDPLERRSLESQIAEFGQTPKQIFRKAHPKKGGTEKVDEDVFVLLEEPKAMRQQSDTSSSRSRQQHSQQQQQQSQHAFFPPGVPHVDLTRLASNSSLPTTPSHAFINSSASFASAEQNLSSLTRPSALSPSSSATAADLAQFDTSARALQLAAEVEQIQTKRLNVEEGELKMMRITATGSTVTSSRNSLNGSSSITPSASSSSASSSSSSLLPLPPPAWQDLPTTSNAWQRRDTLNLHRDNITSLAITSDDNLVSISQDGHIKIYSLTNSRLIRSNKVSEMSLSQCCIGGADGKLVYLACYDNHIYLYNQTYGRVVTSQQASDDAISCLSVRNGHLLCGSWDTTVKMYSVTESSFSQRPLYEFSEHDASLTAVSLDSTGTIGISGAEDGAVLMYDLRTKEGSVRQIEGFEGSVTCLEFSMIGTGNGSSSDILATSADGHLRRIDSGSGRTLSSISTNETLRSLCTDGYTALTVGESGIVKGWNIRSGKEIFNVPTASGAQVALGVNADCSTFAVANAKTLVYTRTKQ